VQVQVQKIIVLLLSVVLDVHHLLKIIALLHRKVIVHLQLNQQMVVHQLQKIIVHLLFVIYAVLLHMMIVAQLPNLQMVVVK